MHRAMLDFALGLLVFVMVFLLIAVIACPWYNEKQTDSPDVAYKLWGKCHIINDVLTDCQDYPHGALADEIKSGRRTAPLIFILTPLALGTLLFVRKHYIRWVFLLGLSAILNTIFLIHKTFNIMEAHLGSSPQLEPTTGVYAALSTMQLCGLIIALSVCSQIL